MRTFGLTVQGTVTAPTEKDALDIVQKLLPGALDCDAVTFADVEVTEQICVECWCYTDADSQRCAECQREDDTGVALEA